MKKNLKNHIPTRYLKATDINENCELLTEKKFETVITKVTTKNMDTYSKDVLELTIVQDNLNLVYNGLSFINTAVGRTVELEFLNDTNIIKDIDKENYSTKELEGKRIYATFIVSKNTHYDKLKKNSEPFHAILKSVAEFKK